MNLYENEMNQKYFNIDQLAEWNLTRSKQIFILIAIKAASLFLCESKRRLSIEIIIKYSDLTLSPIE